MTRTKICGLTCHEDLEVAVEAGADAVGLLVDVPVDSPREIDVQRAVELADATPPFVTTVLVTMPDSPERAVELVRAVEPDALQIHGELGAGDLAYLTATVEAKVLKVVDAADPEQARRYDEVADGLLVDSVDDDGAGGTGRTHDWERTAELAATLDSPVVLAGGLTPANVADAVRAVEPFAVDVASGVEADDVESIPGRKDPNAVAEFVTTAKHARTTPTP
ncbi:phosphoribosylanthranilate isomerase [Halorussus sp. MSC15.2]|uniref:phosphoribosylanthranilate isomerase n=1 Tax=Halorussus sp. MSC15.2 TaxID=2283638 RepID=UPI0013D48C69|nr:phosphoribosylanthranilate isomerase [Halorussus sp. MSC15.2]NEU55969.1 phosphoribosylanthranilate isomerase [Halorussus sp. MSC15.2]